MQLAPTREVQADATRSCVFRHFILKVATRCNLNCTYCYEYNHADQSWRSQPRRMSLAVARQAADRIAEHVKAHQLSSIHISLHGGEPLLLPHDSLMELIEIVSTQLAGCCRTTWSVQTNATLLDERWVDLFVQKQVLVNVSLDGPASVNDRQRVDHAGRGSHERVARGLDLLASRGRDVFAGIYAVIDLSADPLAVVDHLMQWQPSAIDLLIPDAHWSLPPRRSANSLGTDYGVWLSKTFDAWFVERRWGPVLMYTFDELLKLLLGGTGRLDTFGLVPFGLLAVASDGSLHALDTLKTTYEGASSLSADVWSHSLDDLAEHPLIAAFQNRWGALCQTCRQCRWSKVCGGGYYPHRYQEGRGFDRPSVYCEDIKHLLAHIRQRVITDPALQVL